MKTGLYIHIPFCRAKCLYCDFTSFADKDGLFKAYTNAVVAELKRKRAETKIHSIFIGGGTPTALPPFLLARIVEAAMAYNLEDGAEITVEANPGTVDLPYLQMLKSCGVNRLSFGFQAWQDRLLTTLGRIHSRTEFVTNFKAARAAGFDNINVDLIFSIPTQTADDWCETLSEVVTLKPEHISAYSLIIEEGTAFHRMYGDSEPDDELDRHMQHYAIDYLAQCGYEQYEFSNFALAGRHSRHNTLYWERGEYIGVGLGAHSFLDGVRFNNTYDMELYVQNVGSAADITENHITLTKKDAIDETFFLGLRMNDGVCIKKFEAEFGVDFLKTYGAVVARLEGEKLVAIKNGRLTLTRRGQDVSNAVFRTLMDVSLC